MNHSNTNQSPQKFNNGEFNPNDLNQVRQLVDILSPDERDEIGKMLRSCAGEMTLKRGGNYFWIIIDTFLMF